MDFRADFEQFCKDYPVQSRRVKELTFNYRLGGSGDKTLVLLVGGLGISDVFFNLFRDFAKSFKVLTFDYPIETNSNSVLADAIADGEYAIDMMMIAKYFERIGDHATNIAEWVEVSITGKHKSEVER